MDDCDDHVDLIVEGAKNAGTQPVPARRRYDGTYEIPYTPGLVDGVAAGDVIRVLDVATGTFEVVRRGGNLAVKVFSTTDIGPYLEWIDDRLLVMGGRLDGRIDRAAALTIPISAGFPAVEQLMTEAADRFQVEWYFANVYDDNGKPLSWCASPS